MSGDPFDNWNEMVQSGDPAAPAAPAAPTTPAAPVAPPQVPQQTQPQAPQLGDVRDTQPAQQPAQQPVQQPTQQQPVQQPTDDQRALAEARRRQAEYERNLPFMTEVMGNYSEYQDFLKQKREAAEAKAAETQQSAWKAPEVDDLTKRLMQAGVIYVDSDTGLYTSSDPRFQQNVNTANQQASWRSTVIDRVSTDPLSFLKEAGLEREHAALEERIIKTVEDRISRINAEREADEWLSKHEQELYQKDAEGNLVYDQQTGDVALNQRGQIYSNAAYEARQKNLPEHEIHAHARKTLSQYDQWAKGFQPQGQQQVQQPGQAPVQPAAAPTGVVKKVQQEAFMDQVAKNGHVNRLDQSDMTIAARASQAAASTPQTDEDLWESSRKLAEADIKNGAV